MHIEATETIEGDFCSVSEFKAIHPHARIAYIDDKEVLAFCEHCGLPVFDGDDYQADTEGVTLCLSCCEEE